ncbi:MAG TPA: hypothetical protein VFG14_14595 [Chthoniobacteraceae bacterium]|jgi:hypothetical protein|nr:hypothetical protein [Chthoniobacteraceae bacterium]
MNRPFAFSTSNPRQAELLSYLQGLAPVGQPFEFNRYEAVTDLGFGTVRSIYHCLRPLIEMGLIARCRSEFFPKRQAIVVLKRLEEI